MDRPQSDLSVVDVRRHLNEMRKVWRGNRPAAPFYASTPLGDGSLTMSEFAFLFVQSHHRQRAPKAPPGP